MRPPWSTRSLPGATPRRLAAALALGAAAALWSAEPAPAEPLASAIADFQARRFPAAEAAFRRIVAAEPENAAAHHHLGQTLLRRQEPEARAEALRHLARAAELAPKRAAYHLAYGGAELQAAARSRSPLAAARGRDALERALRIDPDNLHAREALFHFHQRAPWPLGRSAAAAAQLEEIRRRDPDLATILGVGERLEARDYAGAFQRCDAVLASQPDNYVALYHYGRSASISGENLERGLALLQRCLQLTPPTPAAPTHSQVWNRIGCVQERLGRPDVAREAYTRALALDPSNRAAGDALERLRRGE